MRFRAPHFVALIIVATLTIYYPSLFAPFNSLDDLLLVHHLLNAESFSLKNIFFPGGVSSYYRPLLSLTYTADKYIWGLHESFMHLENILLHTINAVLVYFLAKIYGETIGQHSRWLPFLAALFFALHPLNTEAVNWISARSDVAAGSFVFGSLIAALLALRDGRSAWVWAVAFGVFVGALFKETALFLVPGLVLLACRFPRQAATLRQWNWWLPFAGAAAVTGYFYLRGFAFKRDLGIGHTTQFVRQIVSSPSDSGAMTSSDPFQMVRTMLDGTVVVLKAIGFYSAKLLQPFPLSFAIDRVAFVYFFVGVLALCLLVFFRRHPVWPIFAVAFFLATSALLILFTRLAWTPIAERYMYIPSGPFAVGMVYWGRVFFSRHGGLNLAVSVVLAVLALFAWGTFTRNVLWQDNLALYQDTVAKAPDFALAKNELSIALTARGREQEAYELLAAISAPDAQYSSLNKALAYARQGDYAGARELLVARLENPELLEFRIIDLLISLTYEQIDKTGDEHQRQQYYRDILFWLERVERKTQNAFNYYRMGRVNLLLGDKVYARRCFAEAAARLPDDSPFKAAAQKLAVTLAQ